VAIGLLRADAVVAHTDGGTDVGVDQRRIHLAGSFEVLRGPRLLMLKGFAKRRSIKGAVTLSRTSFGD